MKFKLETIKEQEYNKVIPNESCVYEMELEGEFRDLGYGYDNSKFKKELLNILPDNTLTMGYMCTRCNTWLNNKAISLCSMCNDNYQEDLADYYETKKFNELYIAFTTKSEINVDILHKNFKSGSYIKSISISRVEATDDNIGCQHPVELSVL